MVSSVSLYSGSVYVVFVVVILGSEKCCVVLMLNGLVMDSGW